LHAVSAYFDEPFADSSSVPMHLLSAFAREKVPVVLSGDGGDELFFGYGHYRAHWHTSLPRKILEHLRMRISDNPAHLFKFFSSSERRRLWRDPSCVEDSLAQYLDLSEAETDLQKINLVDFAMTLPGDILTKVDRASMMHSLEVRSPFLQHGLAEFAYNLPDEYKTDRDHGKLVLARAFADRLPPDFFTRKKQGFGAPIKHWLRKEGMRPLVDYLTQPAARINSLMRTESIRPIVEAFNAGDDRLARRVWTLLTLELWLAAHPENHV
jgi:asparagine synthase (glutamine-hydrolysing)